MALFVVRCLGLSQSSDVSLDADADSRDRIGYAFKIQKSHTMNLTPFHKQAPLSIPVSGDIPASPVDCCKTFPSEHMLQTGKSPRNRACALALVS
jgi:hypothetical protein